VETPRSDRDQLFSALILLRSTSSVALDLLDRTGDGDRDLAAVIAELNLRLDQRLSRRQRPQ
jgi:hypothetical protein